MGISTYQSYNGAQIFDAVGLDSEFTEMYFKGTVSLIGGAGFQEIINESEKRHELALRKKLEKENSLEVGGEYAFRLKGEKHVWDPFSISALQHSIRSDSKEKYDEYASYVNEKQEGTLNPRSLFKIKNRDNITHAQSEYKRLRAPRLRMVKRMSETQGYLYHLSNPFITSIRNFLMRKSSSTTDKRLMRIWDYDPNNDLK